METPATQLSVPTTCKDSIFQPVFWQPPILQEPCHPVFHTLISFSVHLTLHGHALVSLPPVPWLHPRKTLTLAASQLPEPQACARGGLGLPGSHVQSTPSCSQVYAFTPHSGPNLPSALPEEKRSGERPPASVTPSHLWS